MTPAVARIAPTSLALAAVAALAAGCGRNAASASVAAGERAQAHAFAAEVNLQAADVPHFRTVVSLNEPEPPPIGEPEGPLKRQVEQCDGGPIVYQTTVAVPSSIFQSTGDTPAGQVPRVHTVLSAVYLMGSPSVATSYIAAAQSKRGLKCIERDEAAKRPKRTRVDVSTLRPPLSAAPAFGLRVGTCLTIFTACRNGHAEEVKDRLWFAAGPYVVMLAFVAGPTVLTRGELESAHPVASATERRLLGLLYSRAQANKP
ncbi:MAG: hypothetical protein ACHQC8_01760 [Solirubrobacterales bacterium]